MEHKGLWPTTLKHKHEQCTGLVQFRRTQTCLHCVLRSPSLLKPKGGQDVNPMGRIGKEGNVLASANPNGWVINRTVLDLIVFMHVAS